MNSRLSNGIASDARHQRWAPYKLGALIDLGRKPDEDDGIGLFRLDSGHSSQILRPANAARVTTGAVLRHLRHAHAARF